MLVVCEVHRLGSNQGTAGLARLRGSGGRERQEAFGRSLALRGRRFLGCTRTVGSPRLVKQRSCGLSGVGWMLLHLSFCGDMEHQPVLSAPYSRRFCVLGGLLYDRFLVKLVVRG